jgi:superfamily I DNA/RNA helicase
MVTDRIGGRVEVRDEPFSMWGYYLSKWSSGGSAVIARTNAELDDVQTVMEAEGITTSRRYVERHENTMLTWQQPVFLMTAHAAKGLEFERVAIVGLTDSSWYGFDASAEEARLFYVAITRAKNELSMWTRSGGLPFEVEA